jgi:Dolichyl-phosphate-mannose-protein mannosyltransferase
MSAAVSRLARSALAAIVVAAVAGYALTVVHDFYTRVDRFVYTAVDDGEANIAYALAAHGRYAFIASPVLLDQSRLHGQFNYGPWYFYIAAAVIWMFGFSLTAIRAIHLWIMVGTVAAAFLWFRGRDRIAAPALFGLTILYFFTVVQWPMVRPDSLVSACAIALVISAGLAFHTRRPAWWFIAGLSAAVGAFTHLIAASLVASAIALYAWFAYVELQEPRNRGIAASHLRRSGVALAIGLALGAAMFYASFGFDVAMQWRFLNGYREVTATGESFVMAIRRHFAVAFGYFPVWLQASVWLTLAASWAVVFLAPKIRPALAPLIWSRVLPPAMVWTLYVLSNGKYTNYHVGYALLHQVMFPWTAAAVLWALFALAESHDVPIARPLSFSATMLVLILLALRVQARGAEAYGRVQGALPVAFSDYADHVLAPLPARATAWGTVFFGLEAPDRLQLVQPSDATALMPRIPLAQRAALAPDYLVLGYPELRDNLLANLRGTGDSYLQTMASVLPDAGFRLVSLTSGSPYGVTRIYGRSLRAADRATGTPAVAAYDAENGRWYERIGDAAVATFHAVTPVTLHIEFDAPMRPRTATATVAADLPPGQYLLRVSAIPGADGVSNRLIAATPAGMLEQKVGELGARGDFAAYLHGDRDVFLLSDHQGGTLYVSQFDGAGASIASVTAYPIVDVIADSERPVTPGRLPALTSWHAEDGVQVMGVPGHVVVEGDDSPYGYQFSSPVVGVNAGDRVELEVPNVVRRGRVCVGVLSAAGKWLVTADLWRERMRFDTDASLGFRVVFANCRDRVPNGKSLFEVSAASYVSRSQRYADQLVERADGARLR